MVIRFIISGKRKNDRRGERVKDRDKEEEEEDERHEEEEAIEKGNWPHSGISQRKQECLEEVDWENPKVLETMSG